MSNKSIMYSMTEGVFMTTPPVLDRSIQILLFRDPDDKEYRIVITRAALAEEQTQEQWVEKEMENLRFRLPGFQTEGKLLKHQIGPAKLDVIQVANRYLDEGEVVRQVQSVIKIPQHPTYNPADLDVLVFTLQTTINEFTDYQRKHYVQIINSYAPAL
ncbi:DcrB-related protein [Pantoea dispersa]|uniref:DcrB-related protein n=1 Tax=Pantoea dispersa TaxID=59814 RepID=UPI002DBB673C|nr:DcrB-related protein [Pantoea dispersa]MEB5973376.1 DcrB-related protein [Pantoea dispersa]